MDINSLIQENNRLLQENNEILHKLRRTQRIHGVSRIFYWVIILAVSFGAYFWVQPYLENVQDAYSDVLGKFNSAQDSIQQAGEAKDNFQDSIDELLQLL